LFVFDVESVLSSSSSSSNVAMNPGHCEL